jgi:hypothetical protein
MIVLGLCLAFRCVWAASVVAISWSWNNRRRVGEARPVPVKFRVSSRAIATRAERRSGWTLAFGAFFVALPVIDMRLWQQIAGVFLIAMVFGLLGVPQREDRFRQSGYSGAEVFGREVDYLWFRVVSVGEWLGFLGAICCLAYAIVALCSRI